MRKIFLAIPLLIFTLPTFAPAQQWSAPLRGLWMADNADGNLVLVDGDKVCGIVVGDNENSAVKQAAIQPRG